MRPSIPSSPGLLVLPVLAALLAGCASTTTSSGATGSATSTASTATPTDGASALAPSPTPSPSPSPTSPPAPFVLTSSAFVDGAPIPARYACTGADVSPPLAWSGVPAGTASLVLLVDDPDARDFLHWSVLDLPPTASTLPEGIAASAPTPQQGTNDFGKVGYGGPCPPSGTHHYRFTLFALAGPIDLPGHPDPKTVRAALATTTVVARASLSGTFAR